MKKFARVIKNRDFLNLWLGQITSQIALNMMTYSLLINIYRKTHSNTAISGMILTIGLPGLMMGILGGTLVDQWNKRKILVACNLLRAVTLSLFFLSSETIFLIYFLAAITSLISQFFIPAEGPLIPKIVEKEELLTANSLFSFTLNTSIVLGFISAAPFLKIFGEKNIFLFMAALFLLATYFVARLPKEKNGEKRRSLYDLDIKKELSDGFLLIKKNKRIFSAIILLVAVQVIIGVLAALAPGFADRILNINVTDASLIVLGPAAAGVIIGSFLVGFLDKKIRKGKMIKLGIIISGLSLILISFLVQINHYPHFALGKRIFPNPFVYLNILKVTIVLLFILGLSNSLINVPANTVLQEETEERYRGRIYGVLSALVGGVAILPVLGLGAFADLFGVEKVIFALGFLILFGTLYRIKTVDNRRLKTKD